MMNSKKLNQIDLNSFHIFKPRVIVYLIYTTSSTWKEVKNNDPNIETITSANTERILIEISEKDYINYTGIVFNIEYSRRAAKNKLLKQLADAIVNNKTLDKIVKLLYLQLTVTNEFDETRRFDVKKNGLRRLGGKQWLKSGGEMLTDASETFDMTLLEKIENLTVIKCWTEDKMDALDLTLFEDKSMQEGAESYPQVTNKVFDFGTGQFKRLRNGPNTKTYAVRHTTTDSCYLFSFNPHLVVILNTHDYMPKSGWETRKGSIANVPRIIEMAQSHRMSYVAKGNCKTVEEIELLIKTLYDADLSFFKYLSIYISGHGLQGEKIFTGNGKSYNLFNTIILPLQKNESLKNTLKCIFKNTCRGENDPEDDPHEYFLKTRNDQLDANTFVCYSAKNEYSSYRCPTNGVPLINAIIDLLNEWSLNIEVDVLPHMLHEKLQKDYSDFCTLIEFSTNGDVLKKLQVGHSELLTNNLFASLDQLIQKLEDYV